MKRFILFYTSFYKFINKVCDDDCTIVMQSTFSNKLFESVQIRVSIIEPFGFRLYLLCILFFNIHGIDEKIALYCFEVVFLSTLYRYLKKLRMGKYGVAIAERLQARQLTYRSRNNC